MKQRPILFNGEMVRAILSGQKTQTRRIVKFPRTRDSFVLQDHGNGWWPYQSDDGESPVCIDGNEHPYNCPHGQVGDQLWVRETHSIRVNPEDATDSIGRAWYAADNKFDSFDIRWTPSIHMKRWASRITLEITDVRVERLQDISRGDAMDEGCPFVNMAQSDDPRKWYADLWESINGSGSWDTNPWVWVIEFKRIGATS